MELICILWMSSVLMGALKSRRLQIPGLYRRTYSRDTFPVGVHYTCFNMSETYAYNPYCRVQYTCINHVHGSYAHLTVVGYVVIFIFISV